MSLRALRYATGLKLDAGRPSVVQDVPPTPPAIETPVADATTPATLAPSPPPGVSVQEVTHLVVEVTVPTT